jgi:hypothetical protein
MVGARGAGGMLGAAARPSAGGGREGRKGASSAATRGRGGASVFGRGMTLGR